MVAAFEPIVSDREGSGFAARFGEPRVVDEDEHLLADAMLTEIDHAGAELAVVGCRGYSHAVGIARGAASTTLVHEAPCSVLVTRGPPDAATWPRTIVAGLDETPESARAVAVARELADRFGSRLHVVTARRTNAVTLLGEESEDADLVVVGSRRLRGIRALASVSERVAHEARCPVLIVKG